MDSFFYDSLIEADSVFIALDELDISDEEKKELKKLARKQLHEAIVSAILNELSNRDKKIFLANLRYETHDKIWKHLNSTVENIEDKITKAAQNLKEELHKDIRDAKTINSGSK